LTKIISISTDRIINKYLLENYFEHTYSYIWSVYLGDRFSLNVNKEAN